ncbi:TOPRIM nucleotidyl transferase/hydrolase domain-containing protein [Parvularcula marina]|uniref:TOPRIM nucleotidyl transferase/hydrolase domain-containing protein n=1 Tax=Parvularcula marina TaxID=2292771 RepID=UPI0035122E06
MSKSSTTRLSLPPHPARLIMQDGRFMIAKLLTTKKFVEYAKERNLTVDEERLARLERLGVFRPIVRFIDTASRTEKFRVPDSNASKWFQDGLLIDTYDLTAVYDTSLIGSEQSEAYYSIFQLDTLSMVLSDFTLHVQMDGFVRDDGDVVDWKKHGNEWQDFAETHEKFWREHSFRPAIALLCQYISDRYYPHTQGNRRVISVAGRSWAEDPWMFIDGHDWDWYEHARIFDPKDVEKKFSLTSVSLKQAYEALGASACFCDPLDNWSELVEFVSLQKKKRLKGDALRALALRDAANILRTLYRDLYENELKPTHEIFGMVVNRFPELEVRADIRKHLEYLTNQFDLNPQPKLVLFVEGESEVVLIEAIFERIFAAHPGVYGIEIVNLQGVNNATGSRKTDRFRAIFRLVDYLHHHQTMTFLILDRENQAERLLAAAKQTKSLHGQGRLAVPQEHIALWKVSLEFDNFSDTELAQAFNTLSEPTTTFHRTDIKAAREVKNPGKAISELYKAQTGYGLDKPKLARVLAEIMMEPKSRRKPLNRPLVKLLDKVCTRAARNPLPILEKTWRENQESIFLGGKVRPKSR